MDREYTYLRALDGTMVRFSLEKGSDFFEPAPSTWEQENLPENALKGVRVHRSAEVDTTVRFGRSVVVLRGAIIGPHVDLHSGVIVGRGCHLEAGVRINEGARLHPGVTVQRGGKIMQHAVVCRGVSLGRGAVVYPDCVAEIDVGDGGEVVK